MGNTLDVEDIVNSIKKIEDACATRSVQGEETLDHKKFYERVKGLMILVEENSPNKRRGFIMG